MKHKNLEGLNDEENQEKTPLLSPQTCDKKKNEESGVTKLIRKIKNSCNCKTILLLIFIIILSFAIQRSKFQIYLPNFK